MNGVIRAPRCAFAYNLLDNSDFSNPVNQRGATVYNVDTQAYTLDRWEMTSGATPISNMELNSDKSVYYIALSASYGHYIQKIEGFSRYVGKTLTFAMKCNKAPTGTDLILLINTGITQEAVKLINGLNIVKCLIPEGATNLYVGVQNDSSDTAIAFYPEWAAIYEGEYTAETLPPYRSKDYAVELAECQMYLRPFVNAISGRAYESHAIMAEMPLSPPMRKDGLMTVTFNNGEAMHATAYTVDGAKQVVKSFQGECNEHVARYVFYCADELSVGTPAVLTGLNGWISKEL